MNPKYKVIGHWRDEESLRKFQNQRRLESLDNLGGRYRHSSRRKA